MEKELLPYYVIVDMKNLCYLDPNYNFATLENAMRFNKLEEAEQFLSKVKSFKKDTCGIYRVNQRITLNLEKLGVDIEEELNYLIKHNVYPTQTSSSDSWNAHLKKCLKAYNHYAVDSKIVEKEEESND